MTFPPQPLRAVIRASLPAAGLVLLALADPVQAFTPALKSGGEATPLNTSSSGGSSHQSSSSGSSIVRTIVGLLIVIAVIWGLTWVLRQVKSGRDTRAAGSGLTSLASLPLGTGRSVHIVRAGNEYLILGSAEHGVVPIHRYSEDEAREAGLFELIEASADGEQPPGGLSLRDSLRGRSGEGARGALPPSTAGTLLDRVREWTVRR